MSLIQLTTGAQLHVIDQGTPDQTPVIALHGMLGTAEGHLSAVMGWLNEAGYRVIGPTLRGYGASQPKPRAFPPDFYQRDAEDIIALLDALDIPQAHLIGYSDGGEVAMLAAGLQPERCASVAAWGAVGYFGPGMRAIAQRMIPGSAWLSPADLAPHGLSDPDAFARDWVRAVVHLIDRGGDVSLSLAERITCPVLLMLGERDRLNPPAFARQWLDRLEHDQGHLQMFACGHAIHDEQPDAFKLALINFLKQEV